MKQLIIFIAFSLMLNCQEEKKTVKEESSPKEVAKPELILNLEFRTNKADILLLSLNEITVDEFQDKTIIISEKLIPTTTSDKITVNFGPGNVSRKLEIDLGSSELKEFEIVSMSFKYGDNYLDITPDNIEKYFAFSKFTVFDKTSNKIKTQKVDNYHYPKLYARGAFWDQLVK